MFFELVKNTPISVHSWDFKNYNINEKNVFIGTRESLSIQCLVVNYRYKNTPGRIFLAR